VQHQQHMLRRFVAALSDASYRDLVGYTVELAAVFVRTREFPAPDAEVAETRRDALKALAGADSATQALVARRHPGWF
jgi:hypothetical protein